MSSPVDSLSGVHGRACLYVISRRGGKLVGEDEALEAGGHHRAEARLLVAEDEHVFDPGEVLYQCGDVGCRAGHAGRGKAVR